MKRITVKGIMDMMKKEITHSDFGGIDVEESNFCCGILEIGYFEDAVRDIITCMDEAGYDYFNLSEDNLTVIDVFEGYSKNTQDRLLVDLLCMDIDNTIWRAIKDHKVAIVASTAEDGTENQEIAATALKRLGFEKLHRAKNGTSPKANYVTVWMLKLHC
jgi:hypothetical protein